METVRLGKTELLVTKPAIGCLPMQRCSMDEAVKILRRAYDGGINYFDTANGYSDSEEKIGNALSEVRRDVIISTKSGGRDKKTVTEHIDLSLRRLKTDYIDLFQFHVPDSTPDPEDENGAYAAALEAKRQGKILHIGITGHKLELAYEHIKSGLFETLQFPFSYLSSDRELGLAAACRDADMGFIAMKGLAGGLITNARACHAFMAGYQNVVPIWGVQTMDETDEWLSLARENPALDDELREVIEKDRSELEGGFCRGCGYCAPCSADIDIAFSARMNRLLRRMPYQGFLTDEWRSKMHRIEDCTGCGSCKSRCPYGLDIPELLKHMLKDYDEFYEAHRPC